MTWVTEVLGRVRWSDGRLASYREDHVAFGLHLLSMASAIAVTIVWMVSSRWAAWWVLIPLSIASSLALELVARIRLRRTVRRVETQGGRGRAQVKASVEDWVNQQLSRFDDYAIRSCDQKAEEFLARAEAARASGDQKSAAKYRRRAGRERKYSERWRRAVEDNARRS
ncbi:hypothetical protein [Candidatus Poriferisodalis sp.]|uniref:hypothetical protein n=1 Tax=Candidatus Poriferisodalis sp. TaxID=3101277 RepID=UPI003B5CD703